jgi:hypothetical protein
MKEKTISLHIAIFSALISLLVGLATGGYWVGCQVSESKKDRVYLESKFTELELTIKESFREIKQAQAGILRECCSELYTDNREVRK